jgi:hypothetical protein
MRNRLKVIPILLAIGGILFFFLFSIGKEMLHHNIKMFDDGIIGKKRPDGTEKIPQREKEDSENKKAKDEDLNQRQNHQPEAVHENMEKDKSTLLGTLDSSESLKDLRIPELTLDDIARYDQFRKGYILKKIDLFKRKKIGEDLLSLLRILNRKNMPPDYFQWHEYNEAYKEIDLFYHDTYIWPYFSNIEAKTNFFLYQFTRYAADNEQWRFYEKDKSDCSQFSQRIYLFMSPDEIYMPDRAYFHFLFSNMGNREERKKLCNKIPDVFYTTIVPYILKEDPSEQSVDDNGHAMISFAPDNNPENWILGEPQNGTFKRFGEDIGGILDEEYTRYPLIFNLGKILSIDTDYYHEANTGTAMIYFVPKTVFENRGYRHGDPRLDYGDKPIKMEDHTYQLFQFISSHIKQVVNKKPINRINFLRSLEMISWNRDLSGPDGKRAINHSVDTIMYGLIDLEKPDLRYVYEEMKELENLSGAQLGFSPYTSDFMKELSYLFLLKLEPLL